jgi:hypothetical protein
MAASTDNAPWARRKGLLPGDVSVIAHIGRGCVSFEYLGTLVALISANCLTHHMMERRDSFRPGDPRGLSDERGQHFNLHRLPTKAMPGRMKLKRSVSHEFAPQLPGVRELFPEGIPEPSRSEPQGAEPAHADSGQAESKSSERAKSDTPETAEDWKGKQQHSVGVALGRLWGILEFWRVCSDARFRFTDDDSRRLDSIFKKFNADIGMVLDPAVVIDTQAPPQRSFLRLVVNNARRS